MSKTRKEFLFGTAAVLALLAVPQIFARSSALAMPGNAHGYPGAVVLSDAQWKKRLTESQYEVLRQAGTEDPYSSPLLNEHRAGIFACAGCRLGAFSSTTKFDSHTGWPSFYRALAHRVTEHHDGSLPGEERTEIRCARCDGHLGHVFNDGPQPTGLRYCMNGVAMIFEPGKTS